MSETLEQFIVRRRGELDEETSKLQSQLRVVEAEREKIDKVAIMFAADGIDVAVQATPTAAVAFDGWGKSQSAREKSPKRVSEATIKEMVLDILEKEEGDLTALYILDRINSRTGIDYPRTSLSPQLSRLKAEGKIHREGRFWSLGGGPDVEETPDDDEADTNKAPAAEAAEAS